MDYAFLPNTDEGLVRSLQLAETSAMLRAIYRYGQFSPGVFNRAVRGDRDLIFAPEEIVRQPGLSAKRKALELALRQAVAPVYSADRPFARSLFKARRLAFLARLIDASRELVVLDRLAQGQDGSDSDTRTLSAKRERILTSEPLLAKVVRSPFRDVDKGPLYRLLYDIYDSIPGRDLICDNEPFEPADGCPLIEALGFEAQDLDSLFFIAERDRKTFSRFASASLGFSAVSTEENVQASASSVDRLEMAVRNHLALSIVMPICEETVQQLKEEIARVPSRSFDEYAENKELRRSVLATFPETRREKLRRIDEALLSRHRWNRRMKTTGEVLFYVAAGAALLLDPPAAVPMLVWTAGRASAAGAHAAYNVYLAQEAADLAGARFAAGLETYGNWTEAQDEVRGARQDAALEILMPLAVGSSGGKLGRTLIGTIKSARGGNAGVGLKSLGEGLGEAVSWRGFAARMANEKWKRPLLITLGSDAVFLGTQIRRRGLDFYEQDGFWTAAAITVTTDALMTYVNLGGFSPLQRKVGTGAIVLVGSNAGQLAAQGGDLRGIDERRALIEAAFGVGFVVPSYRFAEGSMGVLKNLTGLSDGPLGNAIVLPLFSGRSVVANQAYTDGSIYLFEPPPALGYPWWPQAD